MPKKIIAFYFNLPFGGALYTMGEFAKYLSKKYVIDLYTMQEQIEKLYFKEYFTDIYPYTTKARMYINRGPLLRLQEDYNFFHHLQNLHKKIAQDIDQKNYHLIVVSHDINAHAPLFLQFLKTKTLYYCQEPARPYYEYALNPENSMHYSVKKVYLSFSDYFRKQKEIKVARSATRILSNSYSSNESIYRAYGVYPYVCHLGVDSNKFIPLHLKKENFVYVIGNLSPHKGHKFVIDALSRIPKNKRPTAIIATGGIALMNRNMLYDYAKEKRVDLRILEKISETEHVEMYNKAQATICAAHLETLGLSALESMACETPVIAVREGGYRDMITDKKTGFFVNRDTQELAQTIQDVFSNVLPVSVVKKQARASLFPYWTWEQATLRLERFMENM